jgi:hypothetical protein
VRVKIFLIIIAIAATIFTITKTISFSSKEMPAIQETQEPIQPVINEKNSTAMICNIEDKGYSQNDWLGLKISPTLRKVSYIYFGGLNGQGSPDKRKWIIPRAMFDTESITLMSTRIRFNSDWKDDEWKFVLNRETLRAGSSTFVGQFGWNFEYRNKWQCEIVEHGKLNIEVEEILRKIEEDKQRSKEEQRIREEKQLKKNKI